MSNKLKSKKGRKPVAKILNKNNLNDLNNNECLIVHLPISIEKINDYNNKNDINLVCNKKKKNVEDNFKITSKLFDNKESKPSKTDDKEKNLLKKIEELKNHISKIEKKNINTITHNYSCCNNNTIKKNNNLVCWWCSHKFNENPIYLPDNKINNSYNVYGYFCSFNCAMAFNIELDDYKVWERSNYLNQLYYSINKKYSTIKPAPSKYTLDIYGGELTIDNFREKFQYSNKEFRFILPPLKSIIPVFEELNLNSNNDNNNHFNKLSDNLVIKRKKPLNKFSNSIEKAMNLKIS